MRLLCDVYLYYLRLRTELSLELAQGLDIGNPALRDWAERGGGRRCTTYVGDGWLL